MKRKITGKSKVKATFHGGVNDYEVTQAQTDGVRIEDPGQGRPIIIRQLKYAYHPSLKGRPSVEQLLTVDFRKYLNNILWLDSLELIQEPKVVFQQKEFIIFATCQAKRGAIIPREHIDKLRPLQDTLQNKKV